MHKQPKVINKSNSSHYWLLNSFSPSKAVITSLSFVILITALAIALLVSLPASTGSL
jgi:hypothetical protein